MDYFIIYDILKYAFSYQELTVTIIKMQNSDLLRIHVNSDYKRLIDSTIQETVIYLGARNRKLLECSSPNLIINREMDTFFRKNFDDETYKAYVKDIKHNYIYNQIANHGTINQIKFLYVIYPLDFMFNDRSLLHNAMSRKQYEIVRWALQHPQANFKYMKDNTFLLAKCIDDKGIYQILRSHGWKFESLSS